ncbi:choice-of-anchor A family protein [Telluria beijingensis]|uniref:choice-of-anchor A family protein n=1 Tax=Telluria beijingensis TaxID=3068633 RepID=UPI002795C588|nr:choice-of-anchor A family protein [Massilia sp. REN29]
MIKSGVFLAVAMASASAQAGVIDLGSIMGGASVYTTGNFYAYDSDVEGAIVAGGNVTVRGYAVNLKNQAAFGNHAVVAGGDISLTRGTIHNGQVYAGKTVSTTNATTPPRTTVNPIDFNAASKQFAQLAAGLSEVDKTGKVVRQDSANKVIGSGKGGVDIFNVSADFLSGGNNWKLEGVTMGQTLIFNVSGEHGVFNGGMHELAGYNVLFNFFEAKTVDVKSVLGSVLAPHATVVHNWGDIMGQVVANSWESSVQVNLGNNFKPVDVPGFELVDNNPPVDPPSEVAEPGTLVLMMAGLLGAITLRRRRA